MHCHGLMFTLTVPAGVAMLVGKGCWCCASSPSKPAVFLFYLPPQRAESLYFIERAPTHATRGILGFLMRR